MRRLPRVGLLGTAAAIALSGCTKPTPLVTFSAGSHSETVQAVTYDGQLYPKHIGSLPIDLHNRIRIDVSRELAQRGWQVSVNGSQAVSIHDSHYFTFDVDPRVTTVFVRSGNDLWRVQLTRDSHVSVPAT